MNEFGTKPQEIEQKSLLLEIAEKNGEIKYSENRTLARLSFLRPWAKNPREAGEKDLEKLKNQVENLGIYKPLVICLEGDNGIILGGNMRYKILSELREKYSKKGSDKYEYVWVSVVNAVTDVEKVNYALSDNFSAGKYSREKLAEIIKLNQASLFKDFDLDFSEKESVDSFLESISKTPQQIKIEEVSRKLSDLGIDEDVINDIKEMSMENEQKINSNFNVQKIIGTGAIEFNDKKIFVMKLIFAEENEELYNKLMEHYSVGSSVFKEEQGDLYQRIISVYGRGKGDVLIKTLHLISKLTSDEKAKELSKATEAEIEETKKREEAAEQYWETGRENLF